MKKFSNIKRLGVKSVHYCNNHVLIEDIATDTEFIYTLEYDDINNLKNCINISKINQNTQLKVDSLKNKSGFVLYKKSNKNKPLKSIVKNVKKVSYVQKLLSINENNNIEIQIYHNFEDIKRILSTYFNNILFTINSIYKEISGDISFVFDKIGSIPVNVDWHNFLTDNPIEKEKWGNVYLPIFQKVFNNFGLNTEKDLKVNYIKCLQYIAYKNNLMKDFNATLNEKIKNALDVLLLDKENNKYLLNLALMPANEFYKEANNVPIFAYNFQDKRLRKIFIDKLSNDQILASLKKQLDPNEITYNYLRLLGAIRQYVVHNKSKIRLENNIFINDNAKRDVADFSKKFMKNNNKYFCILTDLYSDDILEEFYNYIILDESKNIHISVKKLKAYITKNLNINNDVSSNNLHEYQNKFKTLSCFIITKYLKENDEFYKSLLTEIKECSNEREKSKIYNKYSFKFIEIFNNFNDLRNSIKKYLGSSHVLKFFDFYPKLVLKYENIFLNAIYVMSKFLTTKESKNMFSKIKTKYENIRSLLKIANFANLEIDKNLFKKYRILLTLDGVNPKDNQEFLLQEYDINKIIYQINLLRSIRIRDIPTEKNFTRDINKIFRWLVNKKESHMYI